MTPEKDLLAGYDSPASPKESKRTKGRHGEYRFEPTETAWSIDALPDLETEYQKRTGGRLPVKNRGQGNIHNQWNLDHHDSADVSLNPKTPEGQKFLELLEERGIPYLAFDRAVPGVSTGPHTHVGRPSRRGGNGRNANNTNNVRNTSMSPENDFAAGAVTAPLKNKQGGPNVDPTLDLEAGSVPPGRNDSATVQATSPIAPMQSKVPPSGNGAKRPVPPSAPAIRMPDVNVLPTGPTYNPSAKYDTQLSEAEEGAFQQWKQQVAPADSGEDYDFRAAFKAGVTPDANGHWPDTFKKPNHPTFSNESQYATGENVSKAGHWEGDTFVPSFESQPSQMHSEGRAIPRAGTRGRLAGDKQSGPRVATQATVTYQPGNAAVLEAGTKITPGAPKAGAGPEAPTERTETFTPGQEYATAIDRGDTFDTSQTPSADAHRHALAEQRRRRQLQAKAAQERRSTLEVIRNEWRKNNAETARNADPTLAQKLLDEPEKAKEKDLVQYARQQRMNVNVALGRESMGRMNEGTEMRGGFRLRKPNMAEDASRQQRREQVASEEIKRRFQTDPQFDAEYKAYLGLNRTSDSPAMKEQFANFKAKQITALEGGGNAFGGGSAQTAVNRQDQESARRKRVADMGWGEYLQQTPKSAVIGFADTAATSLKGVAALAKKLDFFNEYAGKETNQLATYQLGQTISDETRKLLGSNSDLEQEFFVGQAPTTIGQVVSFMLGGWASKAPKVATVILGSAMTAGDAYDEIRGLGGTDDEAINGALLAGGLLGPTELIGMRGAMKALEGTVKETTLKAMLKEALREGRRDMVENALQEVGQEFGQGVITGNPRSLKQLFQAGTLGGLGGTVTVPLTLGSHAINSAMDRKSARAETVPEKPETLQAQMDALADGRRSAVLVTPGSERPTPPAGTVPVTTPKGIMFINPEVVDPETVKQKVADGTYGELLGHVEPKPAPGQPAAVVTAKEGDTEVQTSVVSPEVAQQQAATTQAQNPAADVTVGGPELAEEVIGDRTSGVSNTPASNTLPEEDFDVMFDEAVAGMEDKPYQLPQLPADAIVLPDGAVRIPTTQANGTKTFQTFDSVDDYLEQSQASRPITPAPKVGDVFKHSNPDFDGKRVVGTTDDGRAIITNPDNKTGISRVMPERRAGADRRVTEGQPPLGAQERRDRLARRIKQTRSERRGAQREAKTDALTGLASQRAWLEAADRIDADTSKKVVAVDLKNFKLYNAEARGGEANGDRELQRVAKTLQQVASEIPGAQAFRKGGDEFRLEVPNKDAELARRRIQELNPDGELDGLPVGTSVGIADTSEAAESAMKSHKKEQGASLRPAAGEATDARPEKHPETGRRFSSTQVEIPAELGNRIQDMGRRLIPEGALVKNNDTTESGREDHPHITVKYGLHDQDAGALREVLAGEQSFKARLGSTSIFKGSDKSDYDVVKLDIKSPDLHRINKAIASALPVTDTHPEYVPHITLAYVKKGQGKDYAGNSLPGVTGQEVTFDSITFSSKNGEEVTIPLGGPANDVQEKELEHGSDRETGSTRPGAPRSTNEAETENEDERDEGRGLQAEKSLADLKAEYPIGTPVQFESNETGHDGSGVVQHHRVDAETQAPYLVVRDPSGKDHDIGWREIVDPDAPAESEAERETDLKRVFEVVDDSMSEVLEGKAPMHEEVRIRNVRRLTRVILGEAVNDDLEILRPDNKIGREAFEAATGETLPKGLNDTNAYIATREPGLAPTQFFQLASQIPDMPEEWEHARKPNAEIFPAPAKGMVRVADTAKEFIPIEQGKAIVESWKDYAKRVGEEEDHSQEVVFSLFDRTGAWSKPWEDAGYTVIRYDVTKSLDEDLLEYFPILDINDAINDGRKIIGVLAAPPCTSYSISGAHSWAKQHDLPDIAMVEKKYGWWAANYFDTPLDYANALVHATELAVELANPSNFHALENPLGRIEKVTGLPSPALYFQPHHYGDPYTKKTYLWGTFKTDLPLANVEPTEKSKIAKLRGDVPEQKLARSETPEGFAYSFFMANHTSKLAFKENTVDDTPAPIPVPDWYKTDLTSFGKAQAQKEAGVEGNGKKAWHYLTPAEQQKLVDWHKANPSMPGVSSYEAPAAADDDFDAMFDKAVAGMEKPAGTVDTDARAQLKEAWDRYDDTGNDTIHDLVRNAGAIAEETSDPAFSELARVVKDFEAEYREHIEEYGMRMDAGDEEAIERAVSAIVNAEPEKSGSPQESDTFGKLGQWADSLNDAIRKAGPDASLINYKGEAFTINGPPANEVGIDVTNKRTGGGGSLGWAGIIELRDAAAKVVWTNPNPAAELETPAMSGKESLESAVKETKAGAVKIGDALGEIFGFGSKGNTFNIGPAFDEETYERAKPLFIEGIKHFHKAGMSFGDALQSLLSWLRDTYDLTVEKIKEMKPYIVRFMQDWKAGKIEIEGVTEKKPTPAPALEQDPEGTKLEVSVPKNADVLESYDAGKVAVIFDPNHAIQGRAIWVKQSSDGMIKSFGPYADVEEARNRVKREIGSTVGLDQTSTKGENINDESKAGDTGKGQSTRQGSGSTADASDANEDLASGQSGTVEETGDGGRIDPNAPDLGAAPGESAGPPRGTGKQPSIGSRNPRANRPPVTPARSNFTITDELDFSGVGERARYRNNLQAIRLLRVLETENREATPEEQSVLARYTGWGGLKTAFNKDSKQWADAFKEVKELLTVPEYDAARRSVLDAHYTSKPIVDAIWNAVRQFGWERGAVFEPTMGTGNFFGLMPGALRRTSALTGVEQDHITGGIAKHLYPVADIHAPVGLQDFNVPREQFDLAIGNPPFGDQSLYDPRYSELSKFKIHAYVFAKSVESLRPGGILSMVVSKGLLDASDPKAAKARQWLATNTRLLGAIRLPNTTFLKNAGTEVTTDLIFLQKLGPGIEPNATEWTLTGEVKDPETGDAFQINQYFIRNPDMMLGTMELKGTQYRGGEPALIAKAGSDLAADLNEAIEKLPHDIYTTGARTALEADSTAETTATPTDLRAYSYYLENGQVKQMMPESMGKSASVDVALTGNTLKRMKGMIGLRERVRTLLESEAADNPPVSDAALEAQRSSLNKAYDAFVKEFGYVASDTNKRLFREDADFPLILSLEKNFDKGVSKDVARKNNIEVRAASAEKSDILKRRTVNPVAKPISVDSADDALVASINEKGRVDLEYMQKLYGKTPDQIVEELGDKLYRDPILDEQVETDAYLSGDVKTKFEQARTAVETQPEFKRNVEALEKVIPKDVPASDIFVKLGSTWVPSNDYAQFVADTFEGKFSGRFNAVTGHWVGLSVESGNKTLNSDKWGVKDTRGNSASGTDILTSLLKNQRPAYYETDRDGKRHLLEDLTLAAQGKADELIEEFGDWVWRDGDRRTRVSSLYNDMFNRSVVRKFDGSDMRLPGMNRNVEMRPHQNNAIYRATQDGNILLDHVVGAGKTYVFAAIAMQLRRLGLAHKPMIVVPNHLVEQWATEFKHLYPTAKVLAASRNDFKKNKRRQLFARIATGEWDAVIVAHSSFQFIPVPPDTEQQLLTEQKDELIQAIEDAKKEKGDKFTVRDLEKAKEKIEAKLDRLADIKRDDLLDFAQMGVDALMIDEAHEFKNLFFVTSKKGVAGLGNPQGSQKAFDLFIKTRYLHQKNQGRGVFFATGTPVANSISEVYHMQRYLQYDLLKQRGIHQFDAWANTFGQDVTDWEMDAAGRFKQKTRFSKFANLPELKQMWKGVTDTVLRSDLISDAEAQGKKFPLPKIKGGKPENVVLERSEQQAEFIGVAKPVLDAEGNQEYSEETGEPIVRFDHGTIVDRLENWTQRVRFDPTEIPLKITGEARKAGLDFRLIQNSAPDFKGSKINHAVMSIFEVWKREKHRNGTQLVFCDLSTPKAHKGKATEAAQAKQPSFFIHSADEINHVDGKKVKLQAAPDISFFYYKNDKGYHVSEVTSGLRVASGRTLQAAKDEANAQIAKAGKAKLKEEIEKGRIPQSQIDEYVHQWEAQRAEVVAQEPEGDGVDPVDAEAEISLDDLLADQGGDFSVYDDMKEKLIKAGIPEKEIAFIHDFDTDIQKQALFNKVNRGIVRILFGSTKKMGAGMNVQQRLVALHHMDAPWRPADLEQREGRIIRQGNLFYEEDPDNFEVEIYRYATKQTYDTRMWEIIEQKARSIETFKSDDSLREIEDISSESANAAEMKAGASGDPRILESIQLRGDIRKLEAQEKSFKRSRFDLDDKIKTVEQKKGYPWTGIRDLEAAQAKLAERSDDTPVTIGKASVPVSEITKKDGSTTLINELVPMLKGLTGKYEKRHIGNYRNVNLELEDRGSGNFVINFNVGNYQIGVAWYDKPQVVDGKVIKEGDTVSISGITTRIDNAIGQLPDKLARLEADVAQKEHEAVTAREELTKPWAKAEELATLRERSRVLVAALRGGRVQKSAQGAEEPLPETVDGLTREMQRLVSAKAGIDQSDKKGQKLYGEVNLRLNKVIAARERLVSGGVEERHSGIPFLRSLFSGRSRYTTVRSPLTESDFEEVEKRWQAAKGIQNPGLLKQAADGLRVFFRAFRRHYLHLDPNKDAQTALTTDILRLLESSPAWAKAVAYDHLAEITGTLNKQSIDLLTRNLVLPDVLKDIEEGLYNAGDPSDPDALRELPFGYKTPDEIQRDLEKFIALAEINPQVADAIERRKEIAQKITRRLVELDLLDPSVLEDDRYYHRQVMKYANAQESHSTGTSGGVRQTTKGFQRERVGGGDFNTRYQEAEFEWMAQAYSLIAKAETIEQLDQVNNIVGDLKSMAKALNVAAINAMNPTEDPLLPFRVRIGMANSDLRTMANDGVLVSIGGRYNALIDELERADPDLPFNHPDWFAFLSHLIENELPGAGQAKMIFKAIAERNQFIKRELGRAYKTWQDLVPETHSIWQPEKGNQFYLGQTIDEKVLARVLAGEKELETADVKANLVMGRRKDEWVIPTELAKTLEESQPLASNDPIENLWVTLQNTWKQWTLMSPVRVMLYNFNNMSGDMDIAIAVDPRVLKEYRKAARDLWAYQVHGKGDVPTKTELLRATKLGVIDSGLTIQEIPDINKAGAFRTLLEDDDNLIQRGVNSYWQGVKTFTAWRENILRLAAWRFAREQMKDRKKFYAASNPKQIDAIPDLEARAAKVAREWIGDYGNISVAGKWIRRHMIPFYSWVEINMPRYARLLRNTTINEGKGKATYKVGALTGKKLAMFLLKAHLLMGLIAMFNRLMFPDEEKELRKEGRKPHLILGRAPDGSIRTIKFQGAFADALEWFNLDDYPSDIRDLLSGEKDWKDQAAETIKAPPERFVNSLEPFSKTTFEMATGRQLYPHFFKEGKSFQFQTRPIRDRGQYLAQVLSLGALYSRVTGKPQRPTNKAWLPLEATLVYRTDPGEAAYFEIRGKLAEWQTAKNRAPQSGGDPTARQNALYYFKQASKWNDDKAAKRWLEEYRKLGGTDKGLTQSIRAAHPLGSLARKDWEEFKQSLKPEELEILNQAEKWYSQTYEGTGEGAIDKALAPPASRKRTGPAGPKAPRAPRAPGL